MDNLLSSQFWIFQHFFAVLHFFVVFLFVSHLLHQKKTPTSTIAWFLAVLVMPYIALPLYLLFGSRKFEPRHPPRMPSWEPGVSDPVQRVLLGGGNPPANRNNLLKFLDTGEKAYAELVRRIDGASSSLELETFIFSNDAVAKLVLDRLVAAAQRGVKVRVLLDAVGAMMPGHPPFKPLLEAGGELAYFMPILHRPLKGRANLRNHRKLLVIDDKAALVGGMNIASEYMGPEPDPHRWTDLAFVLEGAIVPDLQRIFHRDWALATKTAAPAWPAPGSEIAGSGPHLAQAIASGPDSSADAIYEMLLTGIYSAKKSVWIVTPYFVPDDSLAKAIELAGRRGVEVRLLIPAKSNHKLADLGRSAYVQQIQAAGARIFLYPKMVHAKTTVIDETYALIGSANMDGRSLLLNYEIGVCLYSATDVAMIQHWIELQQQASKEGFPPPTWLDGWVNGLARMLGPLI